MEEVVRTYRGGCKQEQQRGGGWKALCGTEESASRSSSVEESGRHYVGQRRVQAGAAAWRRVEGIMWDRGECKQEQQRGGEWKALCGTEESASRSSSVEESGRHYVGQKTEETTKRKSVGSLRGTSLYIRVGNTGTDILALALTELQEEKMQIAENHWVRRICKVTQEDRRN